MTLNIAINGERDMYFLLLLFTSSIHSPSFGRVDTFPPPLSQPGHGPLALRTVTGANQGTSPAGLRD